MAKVLVADASETIRSAAAGLLGEVGHQVFGADSGREAMRVAREFMPEIIFVDLALPETGGITLCEQLARDPLLKDIPVVLLVMQGDPLVEALRDWLSDHVVVTKPFGSDGLLAALRGGLARHTDSHDALLRRWADRIAAANEEERPAVLGECLQHLGHDPRVVLSGDLSVVSVAELFQMFALQSQSGLFWVENRDLELEIYFRAGVVDYVYPRRVSPNLVLGNVIISENMLEPDVVFSFLAHRPPDGMFGQQLVAQGLLSTDRVKQALAQQSSELVYELIRTSSGRFAFLGSEQVPAYAREHRLRLSTEQLLLEGCRRADELDVLETKLGNDQTRVFASTAPALHLDARARTVYQLCAGRPLREVIRGSLFSRFETMKLVDSLVEQKLVTVERPS